MVFCVLIFIFLFRTNGRKGNLDENNFPTVMVSCFESAILKVNHSYVESPLSTVIRHTDNSILKGTLE